ncbi:MAG: Rid family hydrolase [Roseiarcus sp.]
MSPRRLISSGALAEADGGLENIVSLRAFVTRAEDCEPVLRVQGEVFAAIRPAAAISVIAGLPKREMKVEIEAAARLGPREGAARAG